MKLIDSYINTSNPNALKRALEQFINNKVVTEMLFTVRNFDNSSISSYHGQEVLENKNEKTLKAQDYKENIKIIATLLPQGWRLTNSYGFVCEISKEPSSFV